MLAINSMQLQKEVKSNPKHPSCKKSVRPQKGHCEKRCEIQGGGQEIAVMFRLMAKFLITTIQMNLCCLLHVSLGFGTKFT